MLKLQRPEGSNGIKREQAWFFYSVCCILFQHTVLGSRCPRSFRCIPNPSENVESKISSPFRHRDRCPKQRTRIFGLFGLHTSKRSSTTKLPGTRNRNNPPKLPQTSPVPKGSTKRRTERLARARAIRSQRPSSWSERTWTESLTRPD